MTTQRQVEDFLLSWTHHPRFDAKPPVEPSTLRSVALRYPAISDSFIFQFWAVSAGTPGFELCRGLQPFLKGMPSFEGLPGEFELFGSSCLDFCEENVVGNAPPLWWDPEFGDWDTWLLVGGGDEAVLMDQRGALWAKYYDPDSAPTKLCDSADALFRDAVLAAERGELRYDEKEDAWLAGEYIFPEGAGEWYLCSTWEAEMAAFR